MSSGGSAPRTLRPVSDDDTVDNFSCRRIRVFSIFSNFERIEKNGPCLTYDYREAYKKVNFTYINFIIIRIFFLFLNFSYLNFSKDSKNINFFYVGSVVFKILM